MFILLGGMWRFSSYRPNVPIPTNTTHSLCTLAASNKYINNDTTKKKSQSRLFTEQVLSVRQLDQDCWCFAVAPLAGIAAPPQLAGRRCPKVRVWAQVPAKKKQALAGPGGPGDLHH